MTQDTAPRFIRNKHTRERHDLKLASKECQIPDEATEKYPASWEYVDSLDDVVETGDGYCFRCIGKYARE